MVPIPVTLIPEPDPPAPCAHCEDGESPEGYCTCGLDPVGA